MICPKCNTDNRDSAKFCSECGFDLRALEGRAASSQEADGTVTLDDLLPASEDIDVFGRPAASDVLEDALDEVKAMGGVKLPEFNVPLMSDEAESDHRQKDVSDEGAASPSDDEAHAGDDILVEEIELDEDEPSVSPAERSRRAGEEAVEELPVPAPVRPKAAASSEATRVLDSVADEADRMFGMRRGEELSAEVTADLSGLERLVDSSYVPPRMSARTGDTMQMPRIDDEMVSQPRSFRAAADRREIKRQKRALKRAQKEQAKRERELARQGAVPVAAVAAAAAASAAEAASRTDAPAEDATTPGNATASQADLVLPEITLDEAVAADAASSENPLQDNGAPEAEHAAASEADGSATDAISDFDGIPSETSAEPEEDTAEADVQAPDDSEEKAPSGDDTGIDSDGVDDADTREDTALFAGIPSADGPSSGDSQPDGAAPKRRMGTGKRVALIAVAVVVIAAAVAAATWAMELWGGKSVPDVSGLSQVDAIARLEESGFTADVVQVKSDEVEGIALSTDPAAGSRAEEGSTVTVSISVARQIPDVVGKTQDEAAALFADEGLQNVEYVQVKSNEDEGTVLKVDPAAGERAVADTKVTVDVAEPYRVPDVAGMTTDDARDALEDEGYDVKVAWHYDEEAAEGTAVSTDPAANTALDSGSTVTLYIVRHRSSELESLTRSFFTDSPTLTIDGMPYEMSEVTSVKYVGNNTCSFSIVARPFETHTWMFGLGSETRYGSYETITGTITWNDDNDITSTDPTMKQGA